jgi:PAS domain S-box-containing protein
MPWDQNMVPEFKEMEARAQSAMIDGRPSYEQEFRVVRDGTVLWLHEQVMIRSQGEHQWLLEGVTINVTAQREGDEAKRVSDVQLQRVMQAADFLLWHARVFQAPDGELHWVLKMPGSSLYRQIFGRDPSEPVEFPWDEVVSAEKYREMVDLANGAIRQDAEKYEQDVCARRDGQVFWLHEQTTIRRLGAGEWQLVGIVTDLTERHRAQEARAASEQALREILERADCMLWRANVVRDGSEINWHQFDVPASRLCTQLLGNDLSRHTQALWNEIDAPDLESMNDVSERAIIAGQPGYEQQFRAIKDGRLYWLYERVTILPVNANEWKLVGVITDVTERQQALEAHRNSEARLEELLRRVDCMIWQGHVSQRQDGELDWELYIPRSHLFRRIFNRDPDGRGFPWAEIGVPEYPVIRKQARDAILGNRAGYEQVFHIPTSEGEIWVTEQVTINRVSADQWEVIGVITDITARREAEEKTRATGAQLRQILEMADCMVWQAKVQAGPAGGLDWEIFTPQSMLFRRLFGDGATDHVMDWRRLNVPEYPQMSQRADEAIRGGASRYEQEFRVVFHQQVLWMREAVTIVSPAPGHWQLVGVITDITARREAQEAQKMSEAQVEQMLATVECLLWQARVFEISPGLLRWVLFVPRSRLYRAIFGCDPGTPAQLRWEEAVDEATHKEIDARAEHHIFSSSPGYEQEFRAQRGDRVFWLHEQVSIVPIGPGEWKLVGVLTDMTARRDAEDAMRASELRYRTLYRHIPMAIVEADFTEVGAWLDELRKSGVTDLAAWLEAEPVQLVHGAKLLRFVDCNDTAMTVLRAKTKRDFSRRRGMLSTADSIGMVKAALVAIWEGRNSFEAEIEMRDFEGHLHDMQVRWWMEADEGRLDLRQSIMVFVDFTKLKQAEAALAAEKERLAVTLRAMAEGVITTDVEGIVQFINPAAAVFTGWSVDAAIGRLVSDICSFENDRTGEKINVPVARVAVGDLIVELPPRTKLVVPGGTDRLVEGCCAPVHSSNGTVIGTVLVFRDVTEHERLEQELVRATRLESIGVLAGGIAHDFNNILTVVLGNIALAALDLEPGSASGRSLQEAEKATLRARDLTQQLLTFAKGGEPVRTAVRLDGVIREITTFTLHGAKVKPVFDFPADLWPADADKGQIGRVVQNLVINAVQAMPEGGTVRIALANERIEGASRLTLPPGDYIRIEITDTGVGIKAEYLPRIFDPYFTTKQMGSGLGLAAVYSIVNKHRGVIDVESHLGRGTTFRLWLPASHAELEASGGTRFTANNFQLSGRVLFMDDEEPIRQMAAFLLRRFGFDVVCVADGAAAVRQYLDARRDGVPFNLVIVDLTVPGGMGGREAVAQLLTIDPQVKAIVSSGYSSDPVLANFREHGFSGMVAKPYEMADLARVLRDVLTAPPPEARGSE